MWFSKKNKWKASFCCLQKPSGDDCDKLSSMVDFIVGKLPPIIGNIPGPDTTTSVDSASVSTVTHSSETDLKERNKPQTSVTSETCTQQSIYVMKTCANDSNYVEEDEIEDVTSDQEADASAHLSVLRKQELPEKKKCKRKCEIDLDVQKEKKQKHSGFVAAKLGQMQSNVNRKKVKKGKKRTTWFVPWLLWHVYI